MKKNNPTRITELEARRAKYIKVAKFLLDRIKDSVHWTATPEHREFLKKLMEYSKGKKSVSMRDGILRFIGFKSMKEFNKYYETQ